MTAEYVTRDKGRVPLALLCKKRNSRVVEGWKVRGEGGVWRNSATLATVTHFSKGCEGGGGARDCSGSAAMI